MSQTFRNFGMRSWANALLRFAPYIQKKRYFYPRADTQLGTKFYFLSSRPGAKITKQYVNATTTQQIQLVITGSQVLKPSQIFILPNFPLKNMQCFISPTQTSYKTIRLKIQASRVPRKKTSRNNEGPLIYSKITRVRLLTCELRKIEGADQ